MMTSPELENLVKIGKLKREACSTGEFNGLVKSGAARLADAGNPAAHALALAALRRRGYRSDNRYIVFQALPHTLGMPDETWRVLAKCHERRNLAEYEGTLEVNERLLRDLREAARKLLAAVRALPPPAGR